MKKPKIKIEAVIAADVQKVWDHYTQANYITNWNFASDDWHCPRAENDLKTKAFANQMAQMQEMQEMAVEFSKFDVKFIEITNHEMIWQLPENLE